MNRGTRTPFSMRRLPMMLFIPLLLLLAITVWRFNFVCDDAFITYRFSRNFAEGAGPRYNIGVESPVEGYTNFLWMIWNAAGIRLGVHPSVWSRVTSFLAATHLLFLVMTLLYRRTGGDRAGAVAGGLFLATLAPFAVWSTGGLATLPFAWLLFLTWEGLLGTPGRPRPTTPLFAAAACLIRADGPLFAGAILSLALYHAARRRDVSLARSAGIAIVACAVALTFHMMWRHAYYGCWLPNTAHAKISPSGDTFEQGLRYVATMLLTFPSLAVAAIVAAMPRRGSNRFPAFDTVIMAATTTAYALFIGGDFMAMGRVLIPAVPFLALAAGFFASGREPGQPRSRRTGRLVAAGLVIALSVPGAFGKALFPHTLFEELHFRRNTDRVYTEFGAWERMKSNTAQWMIRGKALARHTRPGDSIVLGAIGAAAYESRLFVYDRNGLVTRSVAEEESTPGERSPGHTRSVESLYFLDERPTILKARVVKRGKENSVAIPVVPEGSGDYEKVVIPLEAGGGIPSGRSLVLLRRRGK